MVEDSNSNKSPTKSLGTPEFPKEDGTKIPLTTEPQPIIAPEAKYEKSDSKIEMGAVPVFTGLSKEELMKYSNDPFWIRLRMFLFVLFWVAWLAMLVLAIVIIVQAPGCKPPPELLWVEEQALIEVDPQALPSGIELAARMDSLGISSAYFPNLVYAFDFTKSNYPADDIIKHLASLNKQVVTDFPESVDKKNPWYEYAFAEGLIYDDGSWNYTMENLASVVAKEVLSFWITEGVTGFLMTDSASDEKKKFKDDLNVQVKEQKGAVGSDIIDFENEKRGFTPTKFREFLEDSVGNWSFYKFNSNVAESGMTNEELRLVVIGLFLYSGTPVLMYDKNTENSTDLLITHLSKMRSLDGIKLGTTNFANTTENVVAFTRTYKGTPAYAVALNFNNGNETVSFKETPNVGESATSEIESLQNMNHYDTKAKYDLSNINLSPYEGLVVQFVANF